MLKIGLEDRSALYYLYRTIRGGICIDLAKELTFEDEDFYDGAHNTPQGAKKIGRYLYTKLHNVL